MISVTILTKNSQRYIEKVLQPLQSFKEVIVFDTGSTDKTISLARQFENTIVYEHPFCGFGPTHNIAAEKATYDWILSIDSDEIASRKLLDEIATLQLDSQSVYSIPRNNFFQQKHITGCGWYPDRVLRLYNKKATRFSNDFVHETIITKGFTKKKLQGHLVHYPYETIADFLHKMQHYSTLFAEQYKGKKKSSIPRALLHAWFAFIKSYFLKKGLFLGRQGAIISLYNAHTAYYKYLKLAEANRSCNKQ